MEREDVQQSQFISEENFDESSQDAVVNANVALMESQAESAEVTEQRTSPNQILSTPLTPAAPKKSRKATTGKGKQPMKQQKLQFAADDEDSEGEDNGSTSLGKHMHYMLFQIHF